MDNIIKLQNATGIKLANRTMLMNELLKDDGLSRVELARKTGISRGGLTPIVRELISLNLVHELGAGESQNGRKPVILSLNKNVCHIAVIEWKRKSCKVCIADFTGTIIDSIEFFYDTTNLDEVITQMKKCLSIILDRKDKSVPVIALSIITPGPIDYRKGVILNPPNFSGWKNIKVKDIFEKEFKLPVFINNDAVARTIAEKYFGQGKGYEDFISLLVADGIGAGVYIGGELYRVRSGIDHEFGHTTIDMNGILCDCGNRGCIERYASVNAILERLSIQLEKQISWEEVIAGLENGESVYLNALKQEAYYLSIACLNLSITFRPQAIVFTGSLVKAAKYFMEDLEKNLKHQLPLSKEYFPKLLTSQHYHSSVAGGAVCAYQAFINGELGKYEDILG